MTQRTVTITLNEEQVADIVRKWAASNLPDFNTAVEQNLAVDVAFECGGYEGCGFKSCTVTTQTNDLLEINR